MFSSFEVNKFSQLPVNGHQRFVFFVCTGRSTRFDQSCFPSEPELAFRSIGLCRMAATCWLMRLSACLISYQNEKLWGAWFHFGLWMFFFVLSCNANFVSWENFFPEESEWFCRNQAQAFAQDVCLSTMLLHSSFSTGKIPWKEVSVRNLSFKKIPTEIFVPRKNSCWEACWQEHCCWAVCFILSGKDVFRETIGKFLGKDPWQKNFRQGSLAQKFKSTPSTTTWFSSRYAIERDWVGRGLGDKLFQLRYFFVCPLLGCKKFQILFWEKCCSVAFLPRDCASKPFCKESSLQARFFVRDPLFQDSLCWSYWNKKYVLQLRVCWQDFSAI